MKIRNNSQYLTRDLRRIITFALKCWWYRVDQERNSFQRTALQSLRVDVYNRKNGPCTAVLNGYSLNLNLWYKDLTTDQSKKELAWVIRHEIEHLNGKNHKDMRKSYWAHWPKEYTREDWIFNFPLRLKEVKPKPIVDVQELRFNKATVYFQKWQKRVKFALSRMKKYQKQVKRYEVIFATKRKQ